MVNLLINIKMLIFAGVAYIIGILFLCFSNFSYFNHFSVYETIKRVFPYDQILQKSDVCDVTVRELEHATLQCSGSLLQYFISTTLNINFT